ncbi:hypothetical protein [Amycolatopsis australiensis]|uniref:Uncharacterized protein n=1 Tax=Amycolatopsis australiensis TaxID=546364 RepID=A0A1K1SQU6_9PSEU|nr:hypothetical protein [Amycolatopsis australiensis]SFW86681.1 hypothetical protein SAMN04489730_6468 [Amycolatopsis australiensis]
MAANPKEWTTRSIARWLAEHRLGDLGYKPDANRLVKEDTLHREMTFELDPNARWLDGDKALAVHVAVDVPGAPNLSVPLSLFYSLPEVRRGAGCYAWPQDGDDLPGELLADLEEPVPSFPAGPAELADVLLDPDLEPLREGLRWGPVYGEPSVRAAQALIIGRMIADHALIDRAAARLRDTSRAPAGPRNMRLAWSVVGEALGDTAGLGIEWHRKG